MVKKEKDQVAMLRGLFVKLKSVYKKDMYLFNKSFCIVGDIGDEDAIGMIVCILEPQYKEAIETVLLKDVEPSILYEVQVPSIPKAIDSGDKLPVKAITNQNKIKSISQKISDITEKFNKDDLIWKNLGEDEELIKTLFEKKLIFKMPIARGEKTGSTKDEYITISSQMIPLCTAKTISSAFIHYEQVDDYEDLYMVQIKFKFTHFYMEAIYYVIMLPFL